MGRLDDADRANVSNLAENVCGYFSLSPYFFPEYTLHGIDHIRNIINFVNQLIPDAAQNEPRPLSSREISFLICSIIIHDIGMFLTPDGLEKLVSGPYSDNMVPSLDSLCWKDEWVSYIERVRRYSGTELTRLFGESDPIDSISIDPSKMTKKDILVCGDFLRIHHGRLAHEIARSGFMGTETLDIFENTTFVEDEKDLIGLIARSHCSSMREMQPYLTNNFGRASKPLGIRVFYLMSLLRIADYLDAGENRAPEALIYRQKIAVPISQDEWEWNGLIKERAYNWEPSRKCLDIYARPKTTSQFVMVEKWLKSVQQEIDLSWAILLETYPSECPELSIHRIESELLNEECRKTFQQRFVINDTRLRVSPNILGLLIAPLYGNNPTFGVRELLQNAVDACLEREYLENKSYQGEVKISVDTNEKRFEITDNGIGMTEEVLRDYFLSIGSSYRESSEWKRDYVIDHEPAIPRTGRFGIGVLSAFLLGDAIEVTTRNLNDDLGYNFSVTIGTDCIDIRRVNTKIGTSIAIKLNPEAHDYFGNTRNVSHIRPSNLTLSSRRGFFGWCDWYHFQNPAVRYYLNGNELHPIKNRMLLSENMFKSWHTLSNNEYSSYRWSYHFRNRPYIVNEEYYLRNDCTVAFCNGIPLTISDECNKEIDPFDMPLISIIDKRAILECDLSRSKLQALPCAEKLVSELAKSVLAQIVKLDFSPLRNLLMCPLGLRKQFRQSLSYNEISIPSFYIIKLNKYIPNIQSYRIESGVNSALAVGLDKAEWNFADSNFNTMLNILESIYKKTNLEPALLPCQILHKNGLRSYTPYLKQYFFGARNDETVCFFAVRKRKVTSASEMTCINSLLSRGYTVEYVDDYCIYYNQEQINNEKIHLIIDELIKVFNPSFIGYHIDINNFSRIEISSFSSRAFDCGRVTSLAYNLLGVSVGRI